jgi:hypothetical protein
MRAILGSRLPHDFTVLLIILALLFVAIIIITT